MRSQFMVLPRALGARNEVETQKVQAGRTVADALRTGERLYRRLHGVAVISQDCDEAAHVAADPVALVTHGTVPDRWDAVRVAA